MSHDGTGAGDPVSGITETVGVAEEIARIRHELLTPLNQIIGYVEMLIEDAIDMGQENSVPDLHRVRNASNTLVLLINEYFGETPQRHLPLSHLSVGQAVVELPVKSQPGGAGTPQEQAVAEDGRSRILVVDDLETNRDVLVRRLQRQDHHVQWSENGRQALELLETQPFDLVLLDVLMPEMDGYQVLQHMKSDPTLRHIPVIMISALSELDSVVRCIELGAEDYLAKPFNPILLRARIGASLEKKRYRDREQAYLQQIRIAQEKADHLLRNILPEVIADRLKESETLIADRFEDVTVLFADIVGFTPLAASIPPEELIGRLNEIFSIFDQLVAEFGLEKIKTIGDAYMVVGGVPISRPDHVEAIAGLACAMREKIEALKASGSNPVEIRIGIHSGPVVAGVIGTRKFAYDLWGETVNIAHQMQVTSEINRIQVTSAVRDRLNGLYTFEDRGEIEIKGSTHIETAYLLSKCSSV